MKNYAFLIVWTWRSFPHPTWRPAAQLQIGVFEAYLFYVTWSCTSLTLMKSGQLAMRRASSLSCVLQTPPIRFRCLPPTDWYQADSPRNKSFNATTCRPLCLYFRAMDGCRKIWSVSLPTSRWWWLIMWQCASPMSTSAVFHIWDSSRVCGATGQK